MIPELLVEDMPMSVRFYEDVLGFKTEISFPEKDPIFVQVGRNGVHVMLYARSDFENEIPKLKRVKMGGSTLLYIKAEGIRDFYNEIQKKVTVVQSIHETTYGALEFTIEDCNGYLIAFSESLSGK